MKFKLPLLALTTSLLINCTPLQVQNTSSLSNNPVSNPTNTVSSTSSPASNTGGDFNFKRGPLLSDEELAKEKTFYAVELSHPLLLKDIDLSKVYKLNVNLGLDQKEIPEIVYKLKNLQYLDIRRNLSDFKTKEKLPENHMPMEIKSGIANLKNLQTLKMFYFTPIITTDLSGLTHLNEVGMFSTKLTTLPPSLENSSITSLDISGNNFTGSSIGNLPKDLKNLECSRDKLSDVQMLDVINKAGVEVLGENIEYVDKRFVFDTDKNSLEEILGNKKMVVKLTLGVNSKNKSLIDKLPELPNLKYLYFYYDDDDLDPLQLPLAISKCTNLTFFKIISDRINNYESLATLSKLKTLYITGPAQKLPNVTYPDLSRLVVQFSMRKEDKIEERDYSVVDDLVKKNTHIESIALNGLNCNNKDWFSIESLNGCNKLKSVTIKFLSVGIMPDFFGDFKDLYELYLNGCTHITNRIGELQSLMFLNASTKQAELPAGITKLKKLKKLNIPFASKLVKLPEEIGNLSSLELLELSSGIKELPKSFSKLKKLKKLDLYLSSNFTGTLEPLRDLNLEILELSEADAKTSIKDISVIGTLKELKELVLSYITMVPEIPSSFCNLTNLKLFRTLECPISKIPNCIGSLDKLERFSITYNTSETGVAVPESFFSGLKAIKAIGVSNSADPKLNDKLKKAHPNARVYDFK